LKLKEKKKCNFYGNAICKTVRKAVTPKQKCLWKIIKNGKKTICRSRVCCNGKKCQVVIKKMCSKVSGLAEKCTWHFIGNGRCRRKLCCKSGKCAYNGKSLCKRIPVKTVVVSKKEECLFTRTVTKNGKISCFRRMCCAHGKCRYTIKKHVCSKIFQPFCQKVFIRGGNCTAKFCCKLNKKTKSFDCRSRGRRTCFKALPKPKCHWRFQKANENGEVCKKRMCCTGERCSYTSKKHCVKFTNEFCHWSLIRKGKCLKKFCCTKVAGKLICKFRKNVVCKKKS